MRQVVRIGRRRQRRVRIGHWIVTESVCVDGAAIVTTPDIDNGAIADRKRSTGGIRQRGPRHPGAGALFVDVDWRVGRVIAARRYDTGVIHRTAVEQYPGHVHVPANAPTVRNRVVLLGDRRSVGKGRPASKQIKLPL